MGDVYQHRQKSCMGFFRQIDDNFCVNWDFDSVQPESKYWQWCYVSSQCKTLGNGTLANWGNSKQVHPKLAIKTCTSQDHQLRTVKPPQLAEIAEKNNIALGLLAKWAYVTSSRMQWKEYSHMSDGWAAAMRNLTNEFTVLFDDSEDIYDAPVPYHIVSGENTYRVS